MTEFNYDFHYDPLPTSWEVYADNSGNRVVIDRVTLRIGSFNYVVRDASKFCLSTTGKWDFESFPSNRPHDWCDTHRFPTLELAWAAACNAARALLTAYRDRFLDAQTQDEQK